MGVWQVMYLLNTNAIPRETELVLTFSKIELITLDTQYAHFEFFALKSATQRRDTFRFFSHLSRLPT